MSTGADDADTSLTPDDAFAVLGNETRMEILKTLGSAEAPLSFSGLRNRVGISDSGQFNYHLGQLEGHYVRKTDDGYELRQPGRRVIMAIYSGAVTDAPVLEPTSTDESCWFCGAPIRVSFREERVDMYCSECPGTFGAQVREERHTVDSPDPGYLGYVSLPPAGLQNRTPEEIFHTAWTWHHLDMLAVGAGICPRCSATVEPSVDVCDTHETTEGLCEECEREHAIDFRAKCTNCIFETGGPLMLALLANTGLLAFLTGHDRNPISQDSIATAQEAHVEQDGENYDEKLLSTNPLQAEYTFTINADSITLEVGEDLSVVETRKEKTPE